MEALRTEPISECEMPASSVQVVSKVLSQNSSNLFLKNVSFQTPPSSKLVSSNESQLREQLAAEVMAAVHGELDDLRKKIQDAEEDRARTKKELEEYKKLTEKNIKEMAETNFLLKKLFSLQGNASSSTST
jgi:molecular chaperone GrpE (heat shock protein)